jgi:polyhydroxyalkanoate synthesis regulator phasin
MKKSLKKFFALGLGLAAAGYAITHADDIKKAVKDMVKEKKLSEKQGEELVREMIAELEKLKSH